MESKNEAAMLFVKRQIALFPNFTKDFAIFTTVGSPAFGYCGIKKIVMPVCIQWQKSTQPNSEKIGQVAILYTVIVRGVGNYVINYSFRNFNGCRISLQDKKFSFPFF